MALKPATATITDFETSFDAVPIPTPDGDVIWADVRIDYTLSGLAPCVTIRVPVPWIESDTPEERKAKALQSARQLIDHACRAAGVSALELGEKDTVVGDATPTEPSAMEGILQELGFESPSTQPAR
jgi:hypothetical protein